MPGRIVLRNQRNTDMSPCPQMDLLPPNKIALIIITIKAEKEIQDFRTKSFSIVDFVPAFYSSSFSLILQILGIDPLFPRPNQTLEDQTAKLPFSICPQFWGSCYRKKNGLILQEFRCLLSGWPFQGFDGESRLFD